MKTGLRPAGAGPRRPLRRWGPFVAAGLLLPSGLGDALAAQEAPHHAVALHATVEGSGTSASGALAAARLRARILRGALVNAGVPPGAIRIGPPDLHTHRERVVAPRGRGGARPAAILGHTVWIPVAVPLPEGAAAEGVVRAAAGAPGVTVHTEPGSPTSGELVPPSPEVP